MHNLHFKYSPQAIIISENMKSFHKEEFEKWFIESDLSTVNGGHVVDYLYHLASKKK